MSRTKQQYFLSKFKDLGLKEGWRRDAQEVIREMYKFYILLLRNYNPLDQGNEYLIGLYHNGSDYVPAKDFREHLVRINQINNKAPRETYVVVFYMLLDFRTFVSELTNWINGIVFDKNPTEEVEEKYEDQYRNYLQKMGTMFHVADEVLNIASRKYSKDPQNPLAPVLSRFLGSLLSD